MPARHLVHHLGVFASDFAASESFDTNALAALDVQAGYRTESIAEYWMPEHDTPSLSLESAQDSADVTRGLHLPSRLRTGTQSTRSIRPVSTRVGRLGMSRDIGLSTGPMQRSSATPTGTTSRLW